jgi:hypothetical protein
LFPNDPGSNVYEYRWQEMQKYCVDIMDYPVLVEAEAVVP